MIFLRELKARKAKFGFDFGSLTLGSVVAMGKFVEALRTEYTPDKFLLEEAGYNRPEVKLYTDHEEVAEWVRKYHH
jgi:hypothetical protein